MGRTFIIFVPVQDTKSIGREELLFHAIFTSALWWKW